MRCQKESCPAWFIGGITPLRMSLDPSGMPEDADPPAVSRKDRRPPPEYDRGLPATALIVLGSALAALSFNCLLRPAGIAPGGIVGASLVLQQMLGLEPAISQCVLNVLILALCGFALGRAFVIKSLAGSVLLPLFVFLTRGVPPLTTDFILAAVCGGAGLGFGIGLVFRAGSTVGGFSTVAATLHRTWGLPIDTVLFALDACVLLASAYFFSTHQALAALISVFTVGRVARSIMTGFNRSRVALIVSPRSAELRETILKDIPLGLTIIEGRGGYSGHSVDLLMVAMNPAEAVKLKNHIKRLDPDAFMIFVDASEVRGKGFLPHT